ncbi:MAG: hypothetical protein HOJ34_04825 [Kordiimonadaceae bacterium]|nr:hypothetical protein [Kordiimonadaceae bacterium]MBT6036145.1 hypothetical protein [Kordiimonadaceae bacterium]MBT6329088.1 hypothetical protein [Kordiimonadaceae bacterium]MBT7583540.1 hypothetical protein [Kordiimonadaceae bacterium]
MGHTDDLNSFKSFGICYGYGCRYYQKTGLTQKELQTVRDIFSPAASTPGEERVMIARAIARIEQYIGPKTGTDGDKARAAVVNFSTRSQMDCIDEAFNSTSYLYLMRKEGLIKFHTLGAHLRRNFSDLSYPHSTATIHEIGKQSKIASEGHYAVDSWFHKNGALAEIIPASIWIGPWYPKDRKERYNFSAS